MAIKLFRTKVFGSLDELLQWFDRAGDHIILMDVLGASTYTVTYAEVTYSAVRATPGPNYDDVSLDSIPLMD